MEMVALSLGPGTVPVLQFEPLLQVPPLLLIQLMLVIPASAIAAPAAERRDGTSKSFCFFFQKEALALPFSPHHCTVTATLAEAIPFATTTKVEAPVSAAAGTSKFVLTSVVPVATPMVLCPCVRA